MCSRGTPTRSGAEERESSMTELISLVAEVLALPPEDVVDDLSMTTTCETWEIADGILTAIQNDFLNGTTLAINGGLVV